MRGRVRNTLWLWNGTLVFAKMLLGMRRCCDALQNVRLRKRGLLT